MHFNIALDGTAGSGKGTIAKEIAKIFDIYHLDSGSIFRAIAFKCTQNEVDPYDKSAVCKIINEIDLEVLFEKRNSGEKIQKNILDGRVLQKKLIRTEKISHDVSIVAQYPCVRDLVKKIQHDLVEKYDLIIEGRDITTDILPNADVKFFLTADIEERTRRRLKQLSLAENDFMRILKEIEERDKRDMEREIAPLKIAKDAYYIDNTNETLEQTLARMTKIIDKVIKDKKLKRV